MGWGKGTINLPACVSAWRALLWVGWGEGVGERFMCCFSGSQAWAQTKAEEGEQSFHPSVFLSLLGTQSRFQGGGATTSDHRRLRSHTNAGVAETRTAWRFKSG